ncbi:hypothetical protein FB45DRAFT_1006746 [Roridomyces roridus]|uniref:Uncharacterized protein n=1 Tax=Roridomyces roridus TaxID=1738132 RepID=A0AAD7BG89_9AGAR|nr:hypothetical protein FB45DRAFT_1006746 [Roridomyces roridus]
MDPRTDQLLPRLTLADLKKLAEESRKAIRDICGDWFTDPTIREDSKGMWSTDWMGFYLVVFWDNRTRDGKLKIDKLFKETWVLPGTVEMLAYSPNSGGLHFLFTAGGEYYFMDDYVLKKHSKRFTSHQEFVDHVVRGEGAERELTLPDVEVPQAVETDFQWWY